jgi:biotin synthase
VTLPQHRADVAAATTAGHGCGPAADACGSGGGCGPCGGHGAEEVPAAVGAAASTDGAGADEVRSDLVRVRRRGAGTELAPNA